MSLGTYETTLAERRLLEQARRIRELEGQLATATEAAKLNAETIDRQGRAWRESTSELHAKLGHAEKENRELWEKLCSMVVEFAPEKYATVEMILAWPEQHGAHVRCSADGCRELAPHIHERRRI